LLSLQGISEIIKRIAFLQGLIPDPGERRERSAPVEPIDHVPPGPAL
jgi:TRAP-type mannitol/chloroaromatic compound transport system permease small subunit